MDYKLKYLKYKQKYLLLKQQLGGGNVYSLENNDLIEIIYKTESSVETKIIERNRNNETLSFLKENNLLKKENEQFYVFDLHNVLDLLDIEHKIERSDNKKIICCSYVGKRSRLRDVARNEVINRIKSNQLDWGVLVFRRGKERRGEDPFTYHSTGSKAWFCKLIDGDFFFDDSKDHIESVKSIPNLDIKVTQIFNKIFLLDELKKIN